tara:strand:+ start:143 stop:307 length:165 start_codon:yes stop_codon:yes gene_type:complete
MNGNRAITSKAPPAYLSPRQVNLRAFIETIARLMRNAKTSDTATTTAVMGTVED